MILSTPAREPVLVVEVVEDVVVVDREVVAAADALQERGARRVRIVSQTDDRLAGARKRLNEPAPGTRCT
jgi:hypothetical protein